LVMILMVKKDAKPEVVLAIVKFIENLGFKYSRITLGECIMVSIFDLHLESKPKAEDFMVLDGVQKVLLLPVGAPNL